MFYDNLNTIQSSFPCVFNILNHIPSERIDVAASAVYYKKDDFIVIDLVSKNGQNATMNIYLGIGSSAGRYSIYVEESAMIHNYEKFENVNDFCKELAHFLKSPVKKRMVFVRDELIYTDFYFRGSERKLDLFFRGYKKNKSVWFWQKKKTDIQFRDAWI
jgi:hypothetical protein